MPDISRNHGRQRPGDSFVDGIYLPGWEEQSVWGYDDPLASFFAQLWPNGSASDEPEIWLSGASKTYPWPSCIALEVMEHTQERPFAVICGLGIADPSPTLRPRSEILARVRELTASGDQSRYFAGHLQALGWTLGLSEYCPGSRLPCGLTRPSPAEVDAEHHLVTGRVYRHVDGEVYSGADEGLWWALGRTVH